MLEPPACSAMHPGLGVLRGTVLTRDHTWYPEPIIVAQLQLGVNSECAEGVRSTIVPWDTPTLPVLSPIYL